MARTSTRRRPLHGHRELLAVNPSETNIVATTIIGDFMCRATNVDCRMDMPSARAFLGRYLSLPLQRIDPSPAGNHRSEAL